MAASAPKFDVVILGASGFTGKFVLREFLHCMSRARPVCTSVSDVEEAWPPFSLGLAGRNVAKLKESLAWAVKTTTALPERELHKIELMEADALDAAAMDEVCRRARVLVNCVGPCLVYGETIVAACVKAGVHYLDISGEAEFMEKMELKYGERALQSRSLVVSACASVSAISDLGLLFHLRQWPLEALPSSVDAYASFYSFTCNHAASAETGFISLANAHHLASFRRTAPKKPKLKIPGCAPKDKGKFVHYQKRIGVWATAIPICDRAVVRRTFWGLHGHPLGLPLLDKDSILSTERENIWKPIRPVHYRVFFGAHQLKNALLFSLMANLVAILATYTWGKKLLLRYTEAFTMGAFTKKGPSEEDTLKTHFEMWFVGQGYSCIENVKQDVDPDVEVVTRVRGPEPAYLTSAIIIVQSAMMCIHARSRLPLGGILTTATAFGGSHIQHFLESHGLTFEHITTHVGVKPTSQSTSITLAHLPFRSYIIFVLLILILLLTFANS